MPLDGRISYTPNLKLTKLPANFHVWAQIMNDNLTMIDAAVSGFIVFQNLRGPWTNSTVYALGDTVVDPDTAVIWQAQTAHTSASIPTTFLEDRNARPTYWTVYSDAAVARGVWTGPGTVYAVNDFVVAGLQYAVCLVSHTSSASFSADLALGYWSVLIDLSHYAPGLLPTPGGNADANKFAMTDVNGTAYNIFSPDYALGIMGATNIGVGVLRANSQSQARSVIDAAQTTDTVTQLAGDSSTKYATTEFVTRAIGAGASLYVGDAPPLTPNANAMWWNSTLGTLFLYYNDGNSTQWVAAAPTATGPSKLLQEVTFETGAWANTTALIPFDDTIPQITEGAEFMTLSITPQSATSKLVIEVIANVSSSIGNNICLALFQDATANALATVNQLMATATALVVIPLTHIMTSGTTSPTTFRVRMGSPTAATLGFNGTTVARLYGGVMASSIVIREIAP